MRKIILSLVMFLLFITNAKAKYVYSEYNAKDMFSVMSNIQNEVYKINSNNIPYLNDEDVFYSNVINSLISLANDDEEKAKFYIEEADKEFNQIEAEIEEGYRKKNIFTAEDKKIRDKIKENLFARALYNYKRLDDIVCMNCYVYGERYIKLKITDYLFVKFFDDFKFFEKVYLEDFKYNEMPITSYYTIYYDSSSKKIKSADETLLFLKDPLNNYKNVRVEEKYKRVYPKRELRKEIEIPSSDKWSYEDALHYMEYDLDPAYKILNDVTDAQKALNFALFLRSFYPEKKKEIKEALLYVIKRSKENPEEVFDANHFDEYFYKRYEPYLSESNNEYNDEFIISVAYAKKGDIPCALAKKFPEIKEITYGRYGGCSDSFIPNIDCSKDKKVVNFPISELDHFLHETEKANGNFWRHISQGTIRCSYGKNEYILKQQASLGNIGTGYEYIKDEINLTYPYELWSYHSLENKKTFDELKEIYIKVKKSLEEYYENDLGFDKEKASFSAKKLLFILPYGAMEVEDYGRKILDKTPNNLRVRMVNGEGLSKIKEFVLEKDFLKNQEHEKNYSKHSPTSPMIHIAVSNPEFLDLLWGITKEMSVEDQKKYDLESDVNARNNINKTPLMVAAQLGYLESAKKLIEKGADINAVTMDVSEYEMLQYDNRTALMYAAANGGLDMIKLLLNKGADKNIFDTQGYKAYDYLMGFGPLEYNHNLNDKEFEEAINLLK